jgi:hypothetical protein
MKTAPTTFHPRTLGGFTAKGKLPNGLEYQAEHFEDGSLHSASYRDANGRWWRVSASRGLKAIEDQGVAHRARQAEAA